MPSWPAGTKWAHTDNEDGESDNGAEKPQIIKLGEIDLRSLEKHTSQLPDLRGVNNQKSRHRGMKNYNPRLIITKEFVSLKDSAEDSMSCSFCLHTTSIDVQLCRRLLGCKIRHISGVWWDEIVSTKQTSTMSVMQVTSERPGHCSHSLSGKRIKCYMTPWTEMPQHPLRDSLPGEILDVLPSGQWETPVLLKEYFKVVFICLKHWFIRQEFVNLEWAQRLMKMMSELGNRRCEERGKALC